jgi:CHAD domain-containing protein
MDRFDKWALGVPLAAPVTAAAAAALRARLGAVRHFLPLAAKKADEDPEHVHELRVWTRRAAAALDLYDELLPRRRAAWFRKQLKRLRKAANDARDADVFAHRLAESSHETDYWLKRVHAERREAQRPLKKAYKRLKKGKRLARRARKLLRRLRRPRPGGPVQFGDWAHDRLRPFVREFFAAVPSDATDVAALHRFRVKGKELRYAMELLAAAFPPALRETLYPAVEDLQERLGEINDHAAALARWRRWLDSGDGDLNAAQAQLRAETDRLEQARRDFLAWFTPERREELRAGFEEMLTDTRPTVGWALPTAR